VELTHRRGCPALEGFRTEKKRVAVLLGRPFPTFDCTCPEAHWHEVPEFVRARARDKGIDLGGDGHRHRLVTARDANGGPAAYPRPDDLPEPYTSWYEWNRANRAADGAVA
jgi:hypothetical protein